MHRIAPLVLLGLVLSGVPALEAQGGFGPPGGFGRPEGGGMPGGAGGRPGGGMRPPPGRMPELPTEEELAGPPTPGALRQLVALDSTQVATYGVRHEEHLAATAALRDSALAARAAFRQALEARDIERIRPSAETLERHGKRLRKADRTFESEKLEPLLTSEQRKDWSRWREEEEKRRAAERRSFGPGSAPR